MVAGAGAGVVALLAVVAWVAAVPPPALLVLRAACPHRAPFSVSLVRRHAVAAARGHLVARPLRLLGYEDTCAAGWRREVTRAGLAARGAGGALAVAGWPGGPLCAALRAAGPALGRAPPARCRRPAALAAAAAHVAARAGWRVALPPTPAPGAGRDDECAATLRETARALAAVGVVSADRGAGSPLVRVACLAEWTGLDVDPAATPLLLGPPRPPPADNSTRSPDAESTPVGALLLDGEPPGSVYDEILDELERESLDSPPAAGDLVSAHRREAGGGRRRVALLAAVARPTADGDWATTVEVLESELEPETADGGGWAWAGACVGGALALGAGGAAAARVARRPMARGAGGAAVLLEADDFAFPADERPRVGVGVEALSCWLRRLHELPAPDGAPQPATCPSAPSSTCSINRLDSRTKYKGEPVHAMYLPTSAPLELRREAVGVLVAMRGLRHENLSAFVGCLRAPRPALVYEAGARGSLEHVLMADDIRLDWTFKLSLLTDLVRGVRHLHASQLRAHGRLSSRACLVDARWALRVADFGLPALRRAASLSLAPPAARDLLWTAPELLRDEDGAARATQPADAFAFGIIMQEVIVRGEPYCTLSLTPEEIVEKVRRPPPLIRPSVSLGAAPPDVIGVMRQCWSEAPDSRPDFDALHDRFRRMHRGRKMNIVDSMFEMLEKYSNNLEELIEERTEQLETEKKKTEQLLNRMLPRSVAERLLAGSRVEPEEFEDVSIYFSDIVGFTALAARSTPVQVVDLLNDLYTTFDAAIERYRVYKVETIGDAYMVVGGLPARCETHAESVATMALHLLHLAGRFRVRHLPHEPLHLRIGLHSGPVCAAVVGLTMPRYCLFGDTVNTASRMESTGAAWRIQVSEATASRLAAAGGYRLRSRGLTAVKGKGAMHTYWLLGKDGFDEPLPTPPPLECEEAPLEPAGPAPPAPVDCSVPKDKFAWQRSGAVSADGSPPRPPPAGDTGAPHSRYRCLPGRGLSRQWSLERGDSAAPPAPPAPPAAGPLLAGGVTLEPLSLLAPRAPPAPPATRYRTRRDADPA